MDKTSGIMIVENCLVKYFIKINNGVILMSSRNENIQTKIALMNATKKLKQLSYLEFIKFEEYDSYWLQLFDSQLKHFHKLNSIPTYSKSYENNNENIVWLENSLDFLKNKKEWLILVINYPRPVWANVRVLNYTDALEELWESSDYHELIIADKSTGKIAQVFSEEDSYEIHIGKCEITNSRGD